MSAHQAFLSLVDTGQLQLDGVQGVVPSLCLSSGAAHLAATLQAEGFTALKLDLGSPVRVTILTDARVDGEPMTGGSSRLAVAANPGMLIEVIGRAGGE